jgi:hypothetical protein
MRQEEKHEYISICKEMAVVYLKELSWHSSEVTVEEGKTQSG